MGSEQSPTTLHANYNLDKALQQEIHNLAMRKRYVSARINAEQSVTYRRFQQKIRWSQLQQARTNGDKQLIRKLKSEQLNQDTNRDTKTYKDILERRASVMLLTGDFGEVEMRPWTSSAVMRSRPSTTATSSKPKTPQKTDRQNTDEPDAASDHENSEPIELVEDANIVMVTEKVKSKKLTSRKSLPRTSIHGTAHGKKEIKSLMQLGREEPTLLEIHKEVVRDKKYPAKIDALKESIGPLMSTEAGEDYNLIMNKSFTVYNFRKPGFERFDTTMTPEHERLRCEGNLDACNFTLKPVANILWRPTHNFVRNRRRPQTARV